MRQRTRGYGNSGDLGGGSSGAQEDWAGDGAKIREVGQTSEALGISPQKVIAHLREGLGMKYFHSR
jgi:hypothetical protein